MQSEQHTRLRRLAADRLESLQLAGVLQLPRATKAVVRQRAPAVLPSQEPEHQSEDRTFSTEGAVETSAGPNERHAAEISRRESAAPMAKKSGSQQGRSDSLFETPVAVGKNLNPGLTLEVLQQQVAGC